MHMYENIIEVYIYSKYVVDDIGTILQSYSFVVTLDTMGLRRIGIKCL